MINQSPANLRLLVPLSVVIARQRQTSCAWVRRPSAIRLHELTYISRLKSRIKERKVLHWKSCISQVLSFVFLDSLVVQDEQLDMWRYLEEESFHRTSIRIATARYISTEVSLHTRINEVLPKHLPKCKCRPQQLWA